MSSGLYGEKHGHDVRGPLQGVGFVKGAVIEDQQIERIWKRLGKVVEPELEEGSIQPRQFEKEAGAGSRLDGAIEIKRVERVRDSSEGLHAAGGDAPPDNRQQAHAAFILGKPFDWVGRRTPCVLPIRLTSKTKNGLTHIQCI